MGGGRIARVDHSGEAIEIVGEQHAISIALLERPGCRLQPVADLVGKASADGRIVIAHVPLSRLRIRIPDLLEKDSFSEYRFPINCCLSENIQHVVWKLTQNYFSHIFYKPDHKYLCQ